MLLPKNPSDSCYNPPTIFVFPGNHIIVPSNRQLRLFQGYILVTKRLSSEMRFSNLITVAVSAMLSLVTASPVPFEIVSRHAG